VLATTACELAKWNDSDALHTLAAAHADVDNFELAVKWESRAIEIESEEQAKGEFRSRLELYQQKKPYRATNP
jgi:hypothetical protein